MLNNTSPYKTLNPISEAFAVDIIDQTVLPHEYRTLRLSTLTDVEKAICDMQVRGAPLIGVTAAFGLAFALAENPDDYSLKQAIVTLAATRPTAVNLHWALKRMQQVLEPLPVSVRAQRAWQEAVLIAEEDASQCEAIGHHALDLLRPIAHKKGCLNIMTHCNAGSLATIAYGTALAPVYLAHQEGMNVHVWVSETRPRNQGLLTAWELKQHGIPHTVMADNVAGWLFMQGKVDAVIVGADRIAANGDVANKVGTYLKALAAKEANVPFYVAAPHSTIDFECVSGEAIPIEERKGDELRWVHGLDVGGKPAAVRQLPDSEAVSNPAFDVTPAKWVSAIITERGACEASLAALNKLYSLA